MRVNHQHETNNLASNSGLFGCALSAQNCAPISPEKNAKLHTDALAQVTDPVDIVFCCLGTTRREAGSKAAFIHADYTLVVDTALTGRRLGAQHMVVVSAMGANAHSPFFYNRVKGEMEEALIAQNWPRLTIARPSMLLGDRTTRRVNETLFAPLFRLLPGNWKSIDARDVARAMLAEALAPAQEGVTILTSSQLREKAE